MDPLKGAFGVSSENILEFTIHKKEIDLKLAKAKAIQAMEPPITCKQLKSFMVKVSYVLRLALAELLELFHKLLEKNASFQ